MKMIFFIKMVKNAINDLGLLTSFISAHIFKKNKWLAKINEISIEKFKSYRHFKYTFIINNLIIESEKWMWLSKPLVYQRLDNAFLHDELGKVSYAKDCCFDTIKQLSNLNISNKIKKIQNKAVLLYWN